MPRDNRFQPKDDQGGKFYYYNLQKKTSYYPNIREYKDFMSKLRAFVKFADSIEELSPLKESLYELRVKITQFELSFSGAFRKAPEVRREAIDGLQKKMLPIQQGVQKFINPHSDHFSLAIINPIISLINLILPVLRIFTFKQGRTLQENNRKHCQDFLNDLNRFKAKVINEEVKFFGPLIAVNLFRVPAPRAGNEEESESISSASFEFGWRSQLSDSDPLYIRPVVVPRNSIRRLEEKDDRENGKEIQELEDRIQALNQLIIDDFKGSSSEEKEKTAKSVISVISRGFGIFVYKKAAAATESTDPGVNDYRVVSPNP